jgi:hypothetical protein
VHDLLIDLHYLPGIEYCILLNSFDTIYLEAQEHYQKQTLRNRCFIRGANGIQMLTVPVKKPSGNVPVTEVGIDRGQHWIRNHERSIRAAYGKAPFYEYYAGDVFRALEDSGETLFETNRMLLQTCLQLTGLAKEIKVTEAYRVGPVDGCTDLRNVFDARNAVCKGVTIDYDPYQQVFDGQFVRNMSIVDLLFCTGPDAINIVQSGRVHFK